MSVVRFRSVVLDCPDPRALARFYAGVVGGTPEEADADWVVLHVPGGPRLAFQRAEGLTPPEWPRADRNSQQFHLDFDGGSTWEEMDAARREGAGAGRAAAGSGGPGEEGLPGVRRSGRTSLLPVPDREPVSGLLRSPVQFRDLRRRRLPALLGRTGGEVAAAQNPLDVAPGQQGDVGLGPAAVQQLCDEVRIAGGVAEFLGVRGAGVVGAGQADAVRARDLAHMVEVVGDVPDGRTRSAPA